MRPTTIKECFFSTGKLRTTPLCLLSIGFFFASLLTGCATVDTTFDRVKSGVSDHFGGSDKNEVRTLQEDEVVPEPVNLEPAKKPLLVDVQEKLRILGYYSGPISGKLDSRSEAAIQDFQLDNDLRINGRPSGSLLQKIDKVLELK